MSVSVRCEGDVAVVTIDNPPVNATSQAVRAGLLSALRETETDPAVRSVVLKCAGKTFVAGADVSEFDKPPLDPQLPDVVAAIEAATKPWVAAIHGTALGGGLELAMGCHFRVANPKARLGLPEVTLGLIPGAGGTVRLPRLVAAETALTMVAGGKPISADAAKQAGLIDAVAEGNLADAALDMAATVTDFTPTSQRAVRRPENPAAFADIAKRMTRKARGQTSVAEAVEAVERALNLPADEAFAAERARFLELKSSDQAAALRHIFFAERRTLKDRRAEGTLRPVKSIGVVGGGTMGAGIAAACVMRGFRVTMVERDEDALASGEARVRDAVDGTARRGAIADPAEAMARFEGSVGFDALARADLVIEAVFEDMDVKTSVFRQLDHVTRKDAILATNTSYLDVNEIAGVLDDPSRAIGLHFFSPAHVMKLLEIVLPDAVADDVVATAASLSKRLGKIGVLAGVCDGFIGNRIMSAYRQEADFLLEEGATPDQVDMAMRDFGFPIGIFEMQDLAGLDIAWAMRKRRAASRPSSGRYVAIADRLCEMGRFGRKNGAGWYDYVDGVRKASAVVERVIAEERGARASRTFDAETIMTRILTRLGQEARAVLDEGIARGPDDIDVVMVNGYGFPRWRGGPMFRR